MGSILSGDRTQWLTQEFVYNRKWASSMSKGDVEERTMGFANAAAMTRPLLEARRREPGDDLLSVLLQEKIDGEPIETTR